ncbi:hypothetical protein J2Z66_001993 [Paenibacillus eucommiae]|uniref:Uncharacterized protein n=1 Tax=Paenibacillus eucommiae TaxID=1355755 RepID=A0ABS4IS75_9BACL|nr:hypothetical protein [Paenibacillus eucommiae]
MSQFVGLKYIFKFSLLSHLRVVYQQLCKRRFIPLYYSIMSICTPHKLSYGDDEIIHMKTY